MVTQGNRCNCYVYIHKHRETHESIAFTLKLYKSMILCNNTVIRKNVEQSIMGHKPINSAYSQLKGQEFISRYFQANHSFSECSNNLLLVLLSLGEDSRLLQSPEVPLQTLQPMLGSQRLCRQSYIKHHFLALIHVIFFGNDTFGWL